MNDNPCSLYRHRFGHARRLCDQRDSPPEEVIPHWYDIHRISSPPLFMPFAKQRGIFIRYFQTLYPDTVIAGASLFG